MQGPFFALWRPESVPAAQPPAGACGTGARGRQSGIVRPGGRARRPARRPSSPPLLSSPPPPPPSRTAPRRLRTAGRARPLAYTAAPLSACMDGAAKVSRTVDALFGRGASARLPRRLELETSRRTGRIRAVRDAADGALLCTPRPDGGLAVTVRMAAELARGRPFRRHCVEVDAESAPFAASGRSVFCGSVLSCGPAVRPGSEAAVLFGGRVIAVGRAAVPAAVMLSSGRGVAVRVRDHLKEGL